MVQIPEMCEFVAKSDHIIFETKTNGDFLKITDLRLSPEQAASLAWLVNLPEGTNLSIEIKAVV